MRESERESERELVPIPGNGHSLPFQVNGSLLNPWMTLSYIQTDDYK